MKLSDRTLAVLKNFANINSGLVLHAGKVQKTMSPEQTILVQATLEEEFPLTFGIYDLNQFLGNVTMLDSPEISFDDKAVNIKDNMIDLRYHGCATNLIISPPDGKNLEMKNPDITFNLAMSHLQKLLKVSAMNSLTHISIIGDSATKSLFMQGHELKNDTTNLAKMKLDDYDGDDFTVSFKTENLRMLPDTYKVEIKIGGFSCWTNEADTIRYFVAMEKK